MDLSTLPSITLTEQPELIGSLFFCLNCLRIGIKSVLSILLPIVIMFFHIPPLFGILLYYHYLNLSTLNSSFTEPLLKIGTASGLLIIISVNFLFYIFWISNT